MSKYIAKWMIRKVKATYNLERREYKRSKMNVVKKIKSTYNLEWKAY
jgi:hypothetical protein